MLVRVVEERGLIERSEVGKWTEEKWMVAPPKVPLATKDRPEHLRGVVVAFDVGNQFVLKNSEDDVVCSRQGSCPSQQALPVNSVALNGPTTEQRKGNLRTKARSKSQAVFDVGVMPSL